MEQKSGGLSKGCLIGLIIAGAILLLVIITGIVCYYNREKLAKWAATFSAEGLKGEVARHPEIVDTARFNKFIDGFKGEIAAEPFDQQRYATFMMEMQPIPNWVADKLLDSSEIQGISDAMIHYFPGLESLRPIQKSNSAVPTDSLPRAADSAETPQVTDTSAE